eukprot:CAMPEP_0113641760 /NCGR_PEP_ID=MMETSP0017_2-20120614/21933_1 /TAXON_ID=2856 /ORGANISM="Cylindrotheca closterium" /LENGTH=414 /DNA_ID=CAMNT_0000553139 /DNA_START=28 /DNA_END=1272 /DNA_ORIENTATION=- /assembly_acc=CAM_ASM_000147
MSNLSDTISIRLRQDTDDDGDEMEFNALTTLHVDILQNENKIGSIKAWLINRSRIPAGYYYTAFDGHSSTCQWLGCALMEPKLGRTKLESLAPYDNNRSGFVIIDEFNMEDAYKRDENVSAVALSKFLKHNLILQNATMMIYVLPPNFARHDANVFLRNGFFQDPGLARGGGAEQRILVASSYHTKLPLRSSQEVAQVQFVTVPDPQMPQGKDEELLTYTKKTLSGGRGKPDFQTVFGNIDKYLRDGASVKASHAIHVGVANDSEEVVRYLLEKDPSAVNASDASLWTPLMIAATSAAGKATKDGIKDTKVMDLLLSRGADKSLQDNKGMTAYGHYVKQSMDYDEMMTAMCGKRVKTQTVATYKAKHPSERAVQAKLLPPNGPSASDLRGGQVPGIIVYEDEGGFGNDDFFADY